MPSIGDPKWYRECKSLFPCGSPLESTKGWDDKFTPECRQGARSCCRRRAMTARRSCSCSRPTSPRCSNLAPVAKSLLEKAGFKVDLQAMDWQTLVSRRTKKDPPVGRRLARLPHLLGVGRRPRPGRDQLPQRELRQGDVRLAVRCRDREAARRLRQGDRSGEAEGDRRGRAAARRRVPDAPPARPVRRSRWRSARTSSGVLVAPIDRLLEHRGEVASMLGYILRRLCSPPCR